MQWRFADGTRVELGCVVEGDSPLARQLRSEHELLASGRARHVPLGPPPGGDEPLVPSSPYHVDAWCRIWSHLLGVELIYAPALPPLPRRPRAPANDVDADDRGDGLPRVY